MFNLNTLIPKVYFLLEHKVKEVVFK